MRDIEERVSLAADFIVALQQPDGAILALPDGALDPWDHVESAMALDAAGRHDAAASAYQWLAGQQHEDGGLWSAYRYPEPVMECRESHGASYLAVGAWHHYLATGDRDWLAAYWPTVQRALGFALELQAESGEVHWARDRDGAIWRDTLVAGAASVRAALRCGEWAAEVLDEPVAALWREAWRRVDGSFAKEPSWGESFPDRAGRHAMHWYYPVLTGVAGGQQARDRLLSEWPRFIIDKYGCRCVDNRPWVTLAESAELTIALDAAGLGEEARRLLGWQWERQQSSGGFPMGTALGFGEWPPGEHTSWTAAAIVLATDSCYGLSPAGGLFRTLAT